MQVAQTLGVKNTRCLPLLSHVSIHEAGGQLLRETAPIQWCYRVSVPQGRPSPPHRQNENTRWKVLSKGSTTRTLSQRQQSTQI